MRSCFVGLRYDFGWQGGRLGGAVKLGWPFNDEAEGPAGGERSGPVVFTVAYMLVAPCAIVPAKPFLLPENGPPRPSSVSTFPQANAGEAHRPSHAKARLSFSEKAACSVTEVSGSRASFAACQRNTVP